MVVESDGYIALIEYLVESLGLFESQQQGTGSQTIEDLVSNRVAGNLMAICEQNPQLDPKVRFMIMQEADAVVAWLAGHPVVGVDAMCAVLRAHQPRSLIDADGLIRQGCTCGLITERRVGAHTFHQAEMVAEVLR